jgi:CBS domain-containing protein
MNDRKASEASSPVDGGSAVTAEESSFENEGGRSRSASSASVRSAPLTPAKKKIERLGIGVLGLERIRPRRRTSRRQGKAASAASTKVRHFMSSEVSPVRAETSLIEAAQQMRISGVGGIPVLDSTGERCVGILTERDVVIRVLAEERDPRAAIVGDAATLRPIMCAPEDDVATALAQMREYEIQHLPVIAEGKVVGVVSLGDIVFRRPDEERGTIVLPPIRRR